MYRVIISPKAKKELKNIAKLYRRAIAKAIEELKENLHIGKPLTRELTGKYSYRIGVYRVVYKINLTDKKVSVLIVGHRAMVYE